LKSIASPLKGVQTTAARPRSVAVRPATRRKSGAGGTSEAVIVRGDLGFSPPPGIKAEFGIERFRKAPDHHVLR
jgi:hypothetical protein